MTTREPGLVELSERECLQLLRSHRPRLGRMAFDEGGWPLVLPMNYVATNRVIYVRTRAGAKADAADRHERVSFELDHVDEVWQEGWSVLAFGRLRRVTEPEELAAAPLQQLRPWARDDRHDVLALDIESITGRRLV